MSYLDWDYSGFKPIKLEELAVHFDNDRGIWIADVTLRGRYHSTAKLEGGEWIYLDPTDGTQVIKDFVNEKWSEYMATLIVGSKDGDARGDRRYTVRDLDFRFKEDHVRLSPRPVDMDLKDRNGDSPRDPDGGRRGEEGLAGANDREGGAE